MNELPSSARNWRVFLASLGLLLASLFAGRNVATWVVRLRYPGEEHFNEGMRLAEALHFSEGRRVYQSPANSSSGPARYNAMIYGPLYYLLAARLINPAKPAYFPFRLVSLLATVGCAGGCGLLAFWLSRSYVGAALASLTFLCYGVVASFGVSAGCDMVAVFLFFAGFLIAYRFRNSNRLLLAIPLMLLGCFYKQQFVAGPIAVTLVLFMEKRYRLVAWFVGFLIVGGLALLGAFEFVIFGGQAFWDHWLMQNLLPASWIQFERGGIYFGLALLVPFLLALEFLRSHHDKLLACYLGAAVFLGLTMVSKVGSDVNYFLECVIVLSALPAALFAKRLEQTRAAAEVLFLIGLTLVMAFFSERQAPSTADFNTDNAVQEYLRRGFASHAPVFGLYVGDCIRAGLDAPITDIYHYTWLIRAGLVSDQPLLGALRKRQFQLIVLNFDLQHQINPLYTEHYLTAPVRGGILANYQPAVSMDMPGPEKLHPDDRFYAWVPRGTNPNGPINPTKLTQEVGGHHGLRALR